MQFFAKRETRDTCNWLGALCVSRAGNVVQFTLKLICKSTDTPKRDFYFYNECY